MKGLLCSYMLLTYYINTHTFKIVGIEIVQGTSITHTEKHQQKKFTQRFLNVKPCMLMLTLRTGICFLQVLMK